MLIVAPKYLKPIITAILILGGVHLLNAQDEYDPFAESNVRDQGPAGHDPKAYPVIIPKQVAITGGTIGWNDARIGQLMRAVSAFYRDNKRVPASEGELVRFAASRGYAIGSPSALSPVVFANGSFHYSARYSDGRISLSHILLSSPQNAEQGVVK